MDTDDYILWGFASAVIALLVLIVFVIMGAVSTTQGTVVDKYYDDPDVVCSKGCVFHDECWTIEVDGEPWYDNATCVSESEYNTIEIGDEFKED